jgi:phosphoribosyl 1,2-cyclic phosphodiesterase
MGKQHLREAVNVASDAQVKKLVLFHHDPNHDDEALDTIVANAGQQFPQTIAASENAPF